MSVERCDGEASCLENARDVLLRLLRGVRAYLEPENHVIMTLWMVEVKLWWNVPHHQKLLQNIFSQQRELSDGEIKQEVWIRGLNTDAIQMNDKLFASFGIELT
jgi:hypothetical protein